MLVHITTLQLLFRPMSPALYSFHLQFLILRYLLVYLHFWHHFAFSFFSCVRQLQTEKGIISCGSIQLWQLKNVWQFVKVWIHSWKIFYQVLKSPTIHLKHYVRTCSLPRHYAFSHSIFREFYTVVSVGGRVLISQLVKHLSNAKVQLHECWAGCVGVVFEVMNMLWINAFATNTASSVINDNVPNPNVIHKRLWCFSFLLWSFIANDGIV
jgi:hypothetical protein